MVGRWCQRDADHSDKALWENLKYEHVGKFFSTDYEGRGDLFEGLSVLNNVESGIHVLIFASTSKPVGQNQPAWRFSDCEPIVI